MIMDLLIQLFVNSLGAMFALLPEWSWELPPSIGALISSVMTFDDILPISEALAGGSLLFGTFAVIITAKWVIKIIDWIADIIP